MNFSIKKLIVNNLAIKIISLVCGYSLWLFLGHSLPVTIPLQLPLAFEEHGEDISIDAPETVTIYVHGSRSAVKNLDRSSLAVHIDTENLQL